MSDEKSCSDCRNHERRQTGPNAWKHDCRLRQFVFPRAEHCALYDPCPPEQRQHERNAGLGYVWDREYEGKP